MMHQSIMIMMIVIINITVKGMPLMKALPFLPPCLAQSNVQWLSNYLNHMGLQVIWSSDTGLFSSSVGRKTRLRVPKFNPACHCTMQSVHTTSFFVSIISETGF